MAPPGGDGTRRSPARDWVESIVVAIVMALLLKQFILEAYKIPTGSMQPTLIGSSTTNVHDRILVDKLSFRFRDPERWEVVVFRYPLDRSKNFVKRVVGLPGEELRIQNGDLWARATPADPWCVLRRPRSVQRSTWKRLDRDDPEPSSWRPADGTQAWTLAGRSISARGSGKVRFGHGAGSIMDEYAHGYPEALADAAAREHHGGGTEPVGDLRVEGVVRALQGCARIEVQLDEGTRRYTFELPGPAAPADSRTAIRVTELGGADGPRELGAVLGAPFRLEAGKALAFGAQNQDDLLELDLDGDVVAALEIEPAARPEERRSAAHLLVDGEGADFSELMVYRDIHYLPAGATDVSVPADCYFMLGDNTQDSSDSREWTAARFDVGQEDGGSSLEGSWRRGSYYEGANPFKEVGNPEGTVVWFQDTWGERHRFLESAARYRGTERRPFVERGLIQGRALAVFWPVSPLRDLYRLKWVR